MFRQVWGPRLGLYPFRMPKSKVWDLPCELQLDLHPLECYIGLGLHPLEGHINM